MWQTEPPPMYQGQWWVLQFPNGYRYEVCRVVMHEGKMKFEDINSKGIITDTPQQYLKIEVDPLFKQ